jgi:hypothetical protein
MSQFRYVGDEPRQVSMLPSGELRLVEPDQVFTVPDAVWDSYACQPHLYEAQDDDPNRGTVEQTLADVGDDPAAARQALEAERRQPRPRTTLIAQLEKIASAAPEDV